MKRTIVDPGGFHAGAEVLSPQGARGSGPTPERVRDREAIRQLSLIARRHRILAKLAERKVRRQQRGNAARRPVDDGWIEDASRRHVAGEKWDAIAPDYDISPGRLRYHVRKAGLPTRGHR